MSHLRVTEMFEIASKSTLKLGEKGLATGENVAEKPQKKRPGMSKHPGPSLFT